MHGAVTEPQVRFVACGVTLGTTMPKAPVEFVHCVGVCTIPINKPGCVGYAILSPISAVLNIHAVARMRMEWVSSGHEIVVTQFFGSHVV